MTLHYNGKLNIVGVVLGSLQCTKNISDVFVRCDRVVMPAWEIGVKFAVAQIQVTLMLTCTMGCNVEELSFCP